MQNSLRQLINRIRGGTPLQRHYDIINRDTPLFPVDPETTYSFVEDPPQNATTTTINELERLQQMPQHLDEQSMTKANEKYIDILFDCVHHHHNHNHDPTRIDELKADVEQIVKQADTFIVAAKYHYNRPRPRQLAAFYDIELTPLYNPSCPSYPSGHTAKTMVAHLALERLTDDFSYDLDKAKKLVADVAYSRLQAKVHFPSDVRAGILFARRLFTHLTCK